MSRTVRALLFTLAAAGLAPPLALQAAAETFELRSGDRITGEILQQTATHVVIQHPVLGRLELPLAEVAPPEPPRPGLLGTPFLAGWKRTLQLGLNGQRGNTEATSIAAALDLDFEDEDVRWTVDGRYSFSSANNATTKHSALLEANRDRRLGATRWFWFASGRYDWDQFRAWTQRLTLNPGLGYELLRTERFTLLGRAGPAATREFGSPDDWRWEAMLGFDAKWAVAKDHTIELTNRYYQAVNDDTPYRNLTRATWKWKLSDDPALSLNFSVENEYDSAPEGDLDGNDLKYLTTLGIDF